MKGVNDSLEQARQLAKLMRSLRCKINLIPFNPFPGSGYERPSNRAVRDFQTVLISAGHSAMLRTTRGDDIEAACGQLVGQVADRTRRQERYRSRPVPVGQPVVEPDVQIGVEQQIPTLELMDGPVPRMDNKSHGELL